VWQNCRASTAQVALFESISFFGQTFQTSDIAIVAFLVLLEGLLSADNALVLAIMVRHLPKPLQRKALLYGLGGAFVFRLIAIVLASYVMGLWWLQALGAAYLLYLPYKHFRTSAQGGHAAPKGGGFWQTVFAVEMADIAFAIDSVLAGVAVVRGQQEKIWVVYLGAVVGLVLLRFAAGVFIRLLDKYPALDHLAYALVGWVGVKLAFLAAHHADEHYHWPFFVPEMPKALFWAVMGLIIVVGIFFATKNAKQTGPEEHEVVVEEVEPMPLPDPMGAGVAARTSKFSFRRNRKKSPPE
jgi:YkoY family integral membrane protein